MKAREGEWEQMMGHIRMLALEQNRQNEEISKKENRV